MSKENRINRPSKKRNTSSEITCVCGGRMERTGAEMVGKFTANQIKTMGLSPGDLGKQQLDAIIMLNSCLLTGPLGAWKCKACGKTEGGYSTFARNIISIEPLSKG